MTPDDKRRLAEIRKNARVQEILFLLRLLDEATAREDPAMRAGFAALEGSLALLRHYARLLNMYDGGKREIPSTEEWISRAEESEKSR